MDYLEKVFECKTEKELLDMWRNKEAVETQYLNKKGIHNVKINHQNAFVSDGVVNPKIWYNNEQKKRIAFLLKEAYGSENDWSLTDRLKCEAPWSSIWKRVVEWTYGIQNTTAERLARYTPQQISLGYNNEWLNQIAIINIKKSGGVSHSDLDEILLYAQNDKYELRRQLEIDDPDIIVCGYTMGILNELYDCKIRDDKKRCDNWYYFTNVIGGRECLILDYYHPANQYPALINYYGLIGIYQQALLSKLENL